MPPTWTTYAESPFPWERDALDFVRERFTAGPSSWPVYYTARRMPGLRKRQGKQP